MCGKGFNASYGKYTVLTPCVQAIKGLFVHVPYILHGDYY